jgi:hypothetical protein
MEEDEIRQMRHAVAPAWEPTMRNERKSNEREWLRRGLQRAARGQPA